MRMSCNGCRVLRKGCSEDCSIRPCLQWIRNPEFQGNATLFLAKFYGRAGLLNLIQAGPDHLRPAIFRSLLYEACGRIVNPTYGSVGLLWSGRWQLCQAAVEAVLKGAPIMQISGEPSAADSPLPPLHRASSYDIRHIAKGAAAAPCFDVLHKVNTTDRTPFKRSGCHAGNTPAGIFNLRLGSCPAGADLPPVAPVFDGRASKCNTFLWSFPDGQREPSHDSSANQGSGPAAGGVAANPFVAAHGDGDSRENESAFSVETAAASMTSSDAVRDDRADVGLELKLGFDSPHHRRSPLRVDSIPDKNKCFSMAVAASGLDAMKIQGF